ncbi:MAG: SDR family NAD(P)-dependent oxidoreductase [Myxococcales bacterium]|nr:SDR family NAD(P)-dependent oxidoreductase [Myxococcales bacterium]
MSYDIRGKNVLVTGASSGIGAALAEGFARAGAVVGICARRAERLAEVLTRVRAHSPTSQMWTVDLARLDGISEFAQRADSALGGIDVLVNNAGIPKRKKVQSLTSGIVEEVMAINYFSPIRLTLALLPRLIERRGRIVNISSVAARLGPPGEAAYTASKAALTGWSESMLIDLAETGVSVHVVNPGVIDTELFTLPDNDELVAPVEALPVEDIVNPVLEQLASGTFEIYVPEWFVNVVGGKFTDTGKYFDGSIAWLRSQNQ